MMTLVHDVYMCRLDLKVGEHTICAIKPHSLLVFIVLTYTSLIYISFPN